MKKQAHLSQRLFSLTTALALTLSLGTVSSLAAQGSEAQSPEIPAGSVVNTSNDGGENLIQLVTGRSFKAMVPVDMTEEEAKAAAQTATWSLIPDGSQVYLDKALYPNQTEGGPLDQWLCADGETPFFTDIVSGAETADGQTYLTVTFNSVCYFGDDPSTPYINTHYGPGGDCMDMCGYFNLTALVDGESQGEAPVKVVPYDAFHTMAEIYDTMDEMVNFAAENTGLYVEKFSMGQSQGSNGMEKLDMPYLIVAKDREAVDNWLEIKSEAESDPTALLAKLESGELTDFQVPVLYSNIHANEISATDGIIQFTWMLLNSAAGEGTIDYNNLTGFTAEGEAELAREMGEAGQSGSVAVPDLVKDTATYLGYIHEDNIQENDWGASFFSAPVDLEKYYTMETVTVDLDELLDDVFFLIVPEENVEGRTYLTRESSGGFDLNRDNSFQTQAETQNMTHFIASWNPVSYTEFHGRVEAFQCEPCDPPHEPNFEYDLLAEHLMTGGEALGIAAVANNDGHNSYVIPQRDYLSYTGEKTADGTDETCWYDPWDDMSTSYTPQYAMLHGTVSYTVEVPAYNDDTARAVAYGALGQSNYVAQNKTGYLTNQVKIFERGVNNFNSNAYELVGQWFCDQYDVEGAEAELFRPEYNGDGQNGNFYPECYIIPLDGVNQSNLQAASDMVDYLVRNGVSVQYTTEAITYDGVEYPAGTAVVSMYQAKRSVANGVLYDGTVITGWPVLYSEGITAFNKTRGFDMAVCAEPAAYGTIAAVLTDEKQTVTSSFTGVENEMVILSNVSEDSASAVNALLKDGKEVGFIVAGENKGSFVCSYADWQSVADDYLLTGVGVTEADAPVSLKMTGAPVVYINGKAGDDPSGFVKASLFNSSYQYNYDQQALALMGFETTENVADADLIVGAAGLDEASIEAIKNGTAYIGYGSAAIRSVAGNLFDEGVLDRQTVGGSSMDALAYVTYPTENLVNASYIAEGDDILYGYGAGYFASIPEGAQVLVQMDGSKAPLEGFLVGTGENYDAFLNHSIQAISYQENGMNLVLFSNSLTHKVHQRDEFSYISNMAFTSVLGDIFTGGMEGTDVSAWYAENVTGEGALAPADTAIRASLVSVLYELANEPDASSAGFADIQAGDWYENAVNWAASSGITKGTEAGFVPNAPLTREQAVTMLYRYAQSINAESGEADLSAYADASDVSEYAESAMGWAVEKGVVSGTKLMPQSTVTMAELAVMILDTLSAAGV